MAGLGNLRTSFAPEKPGGELHAEAMMADALARAGQARFADQSFVEPLRRLVEAYNNESDLSAFGRYSVRFDVMRCLRNLLYFDRAEARAPQILDRPVKQPIFIMGLPRSGTTFLHSLLALDPGVAVPLSWQMIYPEPAKLKLAGYDPRILWHALQLRIMQGLSPELADLHPLSATAPQECTDITAQIFQSLRFDSTFRVPSYQTWLTDRGHIDAYRFHRRFLQHLDAPQRRWVLKSPDHVFSLAAIRHVYPDAHLVFLHRDPVSVMASVAKLTEVLRRPFTRRIDRFEIGRQVSSSWVDGAHLMMDAAKNSSAILHLHYREVVSSPLETVAKLYRHCGIDFTPEARLRMEKWLGRGTKNGNAQSRYSLAEFGLDTQNLRAQFASYVDAFNVDTEWPETRRQRVMA